MISSPTTTADSQGCPNTPGDSTSRSVLDLAHRLLAQTESAAWPLDRVVTELAGAMGADAAGLADLTTGQSFVRSSSSESTATYPWTESAEALTRIRDAWSALPLTNAGRSWLVAAGTAPSGFGGWLLWVETANGRFWSAGEQAALTLMAQILARAPGTDTAARWGRQLDRFRRQQRLEDGARVAQRLAHDYGNILTTILGFSELSVSLPSPGRPLAGYLKEIHRAAQQGSVLTDQLRLFSRRGQPGPRSADVASVVAEEVKRLGTATASFVHLDLDVAADLCPVFLTADLVRKIVQELLANSREAIPEAGTITVSARGVELTEADCLDLFGMPTPGPSIEIRVADTGSGLSLEARQAVLTSPFFSTKPQRRGLGLATIYGILRLHGGGLVLDPRPEGGTIARVVLPVAPSSAPIGGERAGATVPNSTFLATSKEKVLVVDDDPMVLRLVSTTLERDGYRVQTAQGGAEALRRYTTATTEPFRLVLSDVLMPFMSGVDLARRLVQHDVNVNLMFMSGQVSGDFRPENWGGLPFPLIRKPFRPEGLLQAVRTALARTDASSSSSSPEIASRRQP